MREILFRGKPIGGGEFIYGHYTEHKGVAQIWIGSDNGQWNYLVSPETVGQFTGLTDKNGKKIFEGDRCRVSRPCVLAYGKIAFQNGCFGFVDDGPGGMLRLCDVKMNGFEIEVIGNIHDNPELLEVE